MKDDMLNTPGPTNLPGTNVIFNYFFAADNGFPLMKTIMTPFCARNKDYGKPEHLIFNYRLSRARRVIENVFGKGIYLKLKLEN